MVNVHHKRALEVLAATVILDAALGAGYGYADHIGPLHGVYCATGTATTVGCDVSPHGWVAYALAFVMLLTIVPLFTSAFAFFTTGLTADHVDKNHEELKERIG